MGAAPMQNIGAYGQEVASVVVAVRVVPRGRGDASWVPAEALGFGYRTSIFKGAWRDRCVITGVRLRLRRGRPDEPRYGELAQRLGGRADHPSQVREAVLELRRGKSMLYDTSDPNHRSAGSFFVNPVVDELQAQVVRGRVAEAGLDATAMPSWPEPNGVKLSAAWLMDHSGLHKGLEWGAAGLSSNHCLALINRGGATAQDLIALAAHARRRVLERFGVCLVPEPVFVGFAGNVDSLLTPAG